ncbi:hypothetical protein A6X21_19730 [Planctopirus hydrillae]|uniref:Cytochrome c domain-containing protein n=2 Tax=Planctopirus hydrillae TaxID=1841610 RepID=A0A1C3EHY1_9PLAN|nr:hypothetical protein A6X21_19730 [Planctopirus hydrillae]
MTGLLLMALSGIPGVECLGADDDLMEKARQHFGVVSLPDQDELNRPIVLLGQKLFWDSRLSVHGEIACASCHLPQDGSADRREFSLDARNKLTKRNSQPVFNAALQPFLRWTADRPDAADQAMGSLTGSMGWGKAQDVLPVLQKAGYEELFTRAFPEAAVKVTVPQIGAAISAYEKTLMTTSKWDDYLRGQADALTQQELRGLRLFIETGCTNCHHGALLGGNERERFGITAPYWTETKSTKIDEGLYQSTMKEEHKYVFRVPMLRNIALTSPYYHDGSVKSLPETIRIMGQLQLGVSLKPEELQDLEAFLKTLSGKVPENYRQPDFSN